MHRKHVTFFLFEEFAGRISVSSTWYKVSAQKIIYFSVLVLSDSQERNLGLGYFSRQLSSNLMKEKNIHQTRLAKNDFVVKSPLAFRVVRRYNIKTVVLEQWQAFCGGRKGVLCSLVRSMYPRR